MHRARYGSEFRDVYPQSGAGEMHRARVTATAPNTERIYIVPSFVKKQGAVSAILIMTPDNSSSKYYAEPVA
jgi:hypothetical protein